MATQSLVVSRDPEILGVLRPLMNELGMSVKFCPASRAMHTLQNEKFDTVIVDCDDDIDAVLLAQLRQEFFDGAPARLAENVRDEEEFHAMSVAFG